MKKRIQRFLIAVAIAAGAYGVQAQTAGGATSTGSSNGLGTDVEQGSNDAGAIGAGEAANTNAGPKASDAPGQSGETMSDESSTGSGAAGGTSGTSGSSDESSTGSADDDGTSGTSGAEGSSRTSGDQ